LGISGYPINFIFSGLFASQRDWSSSCHIRYSGSLKKTAGGGDKFVYFVRAWIKRFTTFISAWWFRTSSKNWKDVKESIEKLGNEKLLSWCAGAHLSKIMYIAPYP